ncbi:hypothetical protein Ahu01nite_028840 [Winogradskya humida]|uniref:Uncharacterized protein n=1 Tax=Winogradskya humida TaxID=113566 RepID=A0ABQ3ZMM3_9ACTN|nr:hypothetical protein Ahu01nite_028840 [Actinoplanes humidus]
MLRVQVELPPLIPRQHVRQHRRFTGELHPVVRGDRRGADAVERLLVVDDVPALIVDRVRGVELPRLAVRGDDLPRSSVGADHDVGLRRQDVALVRVGELMGEAAGQGAGVTGHERDRCSQIADDGRELVGVEGDRGRRTVRIAYRRMHLVTGTMDDHRGGRTRRQQIPRPERVPVVIRQQRDAGPVAGQRPDVQRLAVGPPGAVRAAGQTGHRRHRSGRTEGHRRRGQLEQGLGDLVALRTASLIEDVVEVRRLHAVRLSGQR